MGHILHSGIYGGGIFPGTDSCCGPAAAPWVFCSLQGRKFISSLSFLHDLLLGYRRNILVFLGSLFRFAFGLSVLRASNNCHQVDLSSTEVELNLSLCPWLVILQEPRTFCLELFFSTVSTVQLQAKV